MTITLQSLAEEADRVCQRILQDGASPGQQFPNLQKLIQEVLGKASITASKPVDIRSELTPTKPPVHYENNFDDKGAVKICKACGAIWQKHNQSLGRVDNMPSLFRKTV